MKRSILTCVAILLLGSAEPVAAQSAASNDASAPMTKRGDAKFYDAHVRFLRAKLKPMGLVFIGDSITEGWANVPEIWNAYFAKYDPVNFGIGGDRTQHVIWRLEDGELDNIYPKVVVLLIGTNNSGFNTGKEIAAADQKIVQLIREKIPDGKVLLLAIFPRSGPRSVDGKVGYEKRMEVIRAANAELAKLDDGRNVRFLDLGPKFIGPDGKIPTELMPDHLHLSPAGYKLWAEALQPRLDEWMK